MRRIAQLLADLLTSYGYEAMVDSHLTSRSRTNYVIPLAARREGQLVLADGDLSAATVDEVEVHRLVMAATDLGCRTALYLHNGTVGPAALEAAQDRVHFWSRREIVPVLGEAQWAHALGEPLPLLPAPLGVAAPPTAATPTFAALTRLEPLLPDPVARPAPTPEPATPPALAVAAETLDLPALVLEETPTAAMDGAPVSEPAPLILDLEKTDVPEPAPVYRPEPEATRPTITMAEPEVLQDESFLDLGGADLADPIDESPEGLLPEPVAAPEVVALEPFPEALAEPPAMEPIPPEFEDAPAPVAGPVAAPEPEPTPPAAPSTTMGALLAAADVEPPLFTLPPAFRAPEPEPEPAGPTIATPQGSLGLLPPRLTLAEAKAKVNDRLFDIEEAELILQPVHLFDYAVELLREGSLNVDTRSGRLQVNGTDRKVLPTDPAASDPKLPHRVFATPDLTLMDKVCRVSPERARQVASDWATAQHAKTVEVNGSSSADSFDLVEKKTIGPTSGQVKLTYLGLWHRPFWRLWGNNGHADIDAVEGLVLDAEIKGPSADVMLVD